MANKGIEINMDVVPYQIIDKIKESYKIKKYNYNH